MKIGLELTYNIIHDGNIKALSFGLLIKDQYQSSTIKNYTVNSLKNKLKDKGYNFHNTTIKKYIDILDGYGFITMNNNCLTVNSFNTEKRFINIKKGKVSSFKQYVHHIRGAIFKDKYMKARFIQDKLSLSQKKRENIRSNKDLQFVKKIDRKFEGYKIDERGFEYKESISSLSGTFNCSIAEVYDTLKYLIKNGWLKVTNNITKLCKSAGIDGVLDFSQSSKCFVYNGYIYEANCNTYTLNIDSKK